MRGNVQTIRPEIRDLRVPQPLQELPVWLVWRYEARYEGDPKPLKVPYYALGNKRVGKQGSPEDRAKLTAFHVARDQAAKRGMDGVGMAMLEGYDLVALDFDNCVGPDGAVPPDIDALVRTTYAEYSPSGNGIRAVMRGNLGNRKSPTTADQCGFETFATSGYVTLTGNMLPYVDLLGHEDTLGKVTPEVEAYCQKRFGSSAPAQPDPDDFMAGFEPKLGLTVDESYDLLQQLDPDMGRDEWIRAGMALHHEYDGEEEGFELWNDWSAYGSKYPSEEALRQQWDSFTRRIGPGRKQVTMASVKKLVNDSRADKPVDTDALRRVNDRIAAAQFDGKFPARRASELGDLPAGQWLVKAVLPRTRDPVILFGASGSGKSFVALDLACAIARGVEWRGHRVRQGRVLYVAAEGGAGVHKRLLAYCDFHSLKLADLLVDVVTAAPNILEEGDVTEIVKTISSFGPYDLVIIDTLAQVTPGANENAGEDMGRALANIKAVQDVTGATVLVVHHAGKDLQRGSRGWSGLKAAAEAQLEVVRDEDSGLRYMRVEKMKDGEDGAKYAFKLEVLQVGVDEDGDAITSCVTVPDEMPQRTAPDSKGVKRRGRIENHVLEVLAMLDTGVQTIPLEELVTRATNMLPPVEEGKRDTRRQHVTRAIQALAKEKDGPVSLERGLVILFE